MVGGYQPLDEAKIGVLSMSYEIMCSIRDLQAKAGPRQRDEIKGLANGMAESQPIADGTAIYASDSLMSWMQRNRKGYVDARKGYDS